MMNFHDHTNMPSRRGRAYLFAVHAGMAILLAALLVLIFGYVVMRLWNGVMPGLLSVRHITYWQSVGLLLLARILVGGFRHGSHGRRAHAHVEARRQYDDWWREVGQQSYREFDNNRTEEK